MLEEILYWLVSLILIELTDNQKYITSYVFTFGLGHVTWSCNKKSALALSST